MLYDSHRRGVYNNTMRSRELFYDIVLECLAGLFSLPRCDCSVVAALLVYVCVCARKQFYICIGERRKCGIQGSTCANVYRRVV